MKKPFQRKYGPLPLLTLIILVAAASACVKPIANSSSNTDRSSFSPSNESGSSPSELPNLQADDQPDGSTAADAPSLAEENYLNENAENPFIMHTVVEGETLGTIARLYDTTAEELILFNQIEDVNLIFAGDVLRIPGPDFESVVSPSFEIIPDSELVYGPAAKDFNTQKFIESQAGMLGTYEEEVENQLLTGPEVVQLVADRHSVNPKILLAALEYQSGWLTNKNPRELSFPMGHMDEDVRGLYKQLSWGANMLNWGYYGRSEGGLNSFMIGDLIPATFSPEIGHGTAGVQHYLAARDGLSYETWRYASGPDGLFATYKKLFGDPFAAEVKPLTPVDLEQPPLILPWIKGETWYFTGGPHGGWNTGSAWAALDFVPPDVQGGCAPSESWVTAMAAGVVSRSGFGAVVVDLEGDGFTGTGWAITYMHLDNRDRVTTGTKVKAGDRLGHPGCEGGVTNGTHVHIARSYNGRWISADGTLPMEMGGWVSGGAGFEYNGWLSKGDEVKVADVLLTTENAITAD